MDLYNFWRIHGTEKTTALARAAGTTFPYLSHIINYRKRPSVGLAHKIAVASKGEISTSELLITDKAMKEKAAEKRKANPEMRRLAAQRSA